MTSGDRASVRCRPIWVAILFCAATGTFPANGKPGPALEVVADVSLPADTSRFDYESLDADRHLLFIAHLGASEVLAFDMQTRKVTATIGGIEHVHGVLVIPELKRVYASATGTNEVVALDESGLAIIARIPGGKYPDGMAYVPGVHKLYISDKTGATETVIDVLTNRRVATIALGGEAGNTKYDPVSGHIFVNVQSHRQLVEIDSAADKIIARNELPGAKGNHGLLIDARRRLAFVACEDNDKLLVFDLDTHRVKTSYDVGSGPDVLAEDEALGLIYVASESGTVSLFKVEAGAVPRVADQLLAPNAHVVAVDSGTHLAYFPIRNLDGHPVLRITRPASLGTNP